MSDFDDAIEYHEREERRMNNLTNRWLSSITGRSAAYAEAAYAHHAALIHLRRLRDSQPEPEPPRMEAGSGHNFERDLAPVNPDDRYSPWDGFGFQARRRS